VILIEIDKGMSYNNSGVSKREISVGRADIPERRPWITAAYFTVI